MSQKEFETLYDKTIDVLIKRIYNSQMTKEQINELVNQYLSFA